MLVGLHKHESMGYAVGSKEETPSCSKGPELVEYGAGQQSREP